MFAFATNGTTTPAIVDEGIDGFLEHALFVAYDDIGGIELHQALETIVAVDDAAI